jgi:hypothetical protein
VLPEFPGVRIARRKQGEGRLAPWVEAHFDVGASDPSALLCLTEELEATRGPELGRLRVAVGAEGEGTGLDLRIFDASDGEELDRSHGQTSAGVRACAPLGSARTVRVEARASAGKLEAIFAGRLVPSK